MRLLLRELGLEGEPVAIDRLDTPQFLSLFEEGIMIIAGRPGGERRARGEDAGKRSS